MALRHREVNGGQGQVVDVALYEAIFAMMESMVPEFDVFGSFANAPATSCPASPLLDPHQRRRQTCADRRQWRCDLQALHAAIGREDLANDPCWPAMTDATAAATSCMA
jgi:formyl-CoA transferase